LSDQITIDATDERILRILMEESRTSFTKISKECNITVAAIRKRYNRLWKLGVINGEIMQVNPQNLGYKCIVNIGVITDNEDENEVIEFLKSKPYIVAVFSKLFDRVNIDANICLPEYEKLHETLKEIESNPLIKQLITRFWLKTSNLDYPKNLILTNSSGKIDNGCQQKNGIASPKKVEMDELDRQIAKILINNSREPFAKIAQELNISTKKVRQRYSKLKGSILTKSLITINLKKLGYNTIVYLRLEIADKSRIPEISAKILKIPNVITLIELVGGDYDLFPSIVLRDYSELFGLKEQLSKIQGIKKATMILFEPFDAWPPNMFASLLSNHGNEPIS